MLIIERDSTRTMCLDIPSPDPELSQLALEGGGRVRVRARVSVFESRNVSGRQLDYESEFSIDNLFRSTSPYHRPPILISKTSVT